MIITDITGIGDPQILLHNGTYYCYATGHNPDGFCVWVSDDLVSWSEPIPCFAAARYWGNADFWAPEVVFHGGRFVMHYSARSRELGSLRIGVAVSEHPTGPFVDVHGKPMLELGYAVIDVSVLRSPEGNFLYYSRDCSENTVGGMKTSQIYCVRLNDDLTEVCGEPVPISTPNEPYELRSAPMGVLWNEGPFVMRVGERYVMNYSANCYATNDYAICLASADAPMGPFEKAASNPVLSCDERLFGAGHNALFYGKDGALYTSFHIQTDPAHPSGDRRLVIGRVELTERDGVLTERIF